MPEERRDEIAKELFAFALRKTGDASTADDIVQETLGVALEKDAPPGNEGPWLFGVLRNKLRRLLAKRVRRREVVLEPAAAGPVAAAGPEEAASLEEEKARVARALSRLEEELAQVVRLTYEERLSHREIAERLAVPATTVQSRLRSALRELHAALMERAEGEK